MKTMKILNKYFLIILILFFSFIMPGCFFKKEQSKNLLDEFYIASSNYFQSTSKSITKQPISYIGENSKQGGIDGLTEKYNNSSKFRITYYYIKTNGVKIDIITQTNKKYIQFIYHYDTFLYSKYTYNYLSNNLYYETNNKDEVEMNTFLFDIVLKDYLAVNESYYTIEELYDLIVK